MEEQKYHKPVMLNESIAAMNLQQDGVYVDVTFGGGGHSKQILNNLGQFTLLFDGIWVMRSCSALFNKGP